MQHLFTNSTNIPMGNSLNGVGVASNLTSHSGQRPLHLFSFVPNATGAVGGDGDSISISNRSAHSQRNKVEAMASSTATLHREIGTGAKQLLQKLMTSFGLNSCPPIPPDLHGPIEVDTAYEKLESVETRLHGKLLPGGTFKPTECNAKDRVAIVIPYRDRAHHLPIFLKNIHPFLMKQQIEYGIFVVEQIADGLFNRAALMNIGFVEALKINDWDCFIFHDIDLLPMDDRNLYTCPDQPRHMSVAVDTMGFKYDHKYLTFDMRCMCISIRYRLSIPFQVAVQFDFWRRIRNDGQTIPNRKWIFEFVLGMGRRRRWHVKSVSGQLLIPFRARFCIDIESISFRLKHVGYHIARYPVNIARYTMLSHRKERANPRR